MQLKQIETFFWAARLGSFARAARHLNATTSSVSMRIQELEKRLGVVLFDRANRKTWLTSDGLYLLPLAEQLLAASDRIFKPTSDGDGLSGYVRLGVAEVVAVSYLPSFLAEFRTRFPGIRLEIEVALSHVLEDKLDVGTLDAALAPCQLSPSRFDHIPLSSEDFRWMCSPNLTSIPAEVTPAEFMDLPLIVTSREQLLRGSILRWINENQVTFRNPTICNTFTIAGKMALAGIGCAFLPMRVYAENIRRRQLRIVECRPPIGRLEHFVIRPIGELDPVLDAVENVALLAARLAGDNGSPDRAAAE
jgi:DNA-binding transcriptional LysR family regulator